MIQYPEITVDDLLGDLPRTIEYALIAAAERTLDFARGYSGELVLHGSHPGRPRHNSQGGPPGWADKNHEMVLRFDYDIVPLPGGKAAITMVNTAPHAGLVESKGYFVVEGLDEHFLQLMSSVIDELV